MTDKESRQNCVCSDCEDIRKAISILDDGTQTPEVVEATAILAAIVGADWDERTRRYNV